MDSGTTAQHETGSRPDNGGARRTRFGIRGRLILLIVVLVAATALAVTEWIFQRFNNELIARKTQELSDETLLQGTRFNARIEELQADALFLAGTPPIQGIIRAHQAGGVDPRDGSSERQWRERLATIFERMIRVKRHYLQLRYIGIAGDGLEIVRVDRMGPGGSVQVTPQDQLQPKGDTGYFRHAILNKPGQVSLSRIDLNRERGVITEPVIPVIRASVPVYGDDGRLFGILVINQDIRTVFNTVLQVTDKGHVYYITDERGEYLYHPDAARTFRFEYGGSRRLQDDYPEFAGFYTAPGTQEITRVIRNPAGGTSVASLRKVDYDPSNRLRKIGIMALDDYATVTQVSRAVLNQSYLIISAMVLLAVSGGMLFARRLTRPILEMAAAARRYARGGGNLSLPQDDPGEAGILARAFADMIGEIDSRTRRLQEEVRERQRAETYATSLVNTAPDAVINIDQDGIIRTFNPAAVDLFGYRADEVVGRNVKMLMPPPYHDEHDGYLANYLRTGEKKIIGTGREVQGLRKDGSVLELELTVGESRLEEGSTFTGMIRDISVRKQAEASLRRYEAIVNSASDMIVFFDANRVIRAVNRTFLQALGRDRDQVEGFDPYDLDQELPMISVITRDLTKLQAGEEVGTSVVSYRRNMQTRHIDLSYTLHRDAAGALLGVILIGRDITEITQSQNELQRSNRELEQFAYVASHDLQEPLRSITSYTQLLERRYSDRLDDTAREFMDFVVDGAKRMQVLINDLLAFSRVNTSNRAFTTVDCNALLQRVLEDLSLALRESRAEVTVDPLPQVQGDETLLRQVFQNLVANAIKYRDPGRQCRVYVGAEREQNAWRFTVRDNGIGIDRDFYDRIFVIFQRLHGKKEYSGTGIGLALCKKIVERHDGRIWVQSEPGAGTEFMFTIADV